MSFLKKKEKMEEVSEAPNITIDTGEDILSISPHLMEENEHTSDFMHVGNHKDMGCYGLLNIYNLKKYKAIYCRQCGLRIRIPIRITTAEELKEFLEREV